MENYLNKVIADAEEAFWTSVSKNLPLITSGDFDPMSHNVFADACENAVKEWIKQNL